MAEVAQRNPHSDPPELADTLDRVRSWSAEQAEVYRGLVRSARDAEATEFLVNALLRQSAPFASTLGAWLQGMSAPGVFEDEVHLKVLALYADDIGVGKPWSSRHDEFKVLAKQLGRPELAVDAAGLAAVREVRDDLFALPAALLAISRRADEFASVIAGLDVVMRTVGAPWWDALRSLDGPRIEWDRLDLGKPTGATEVSAPTELSTWVAEKFSAVGREHRCQVDFGAAWLFDALKVWNELLLHEVEGALHPERAMELLLRKRAREGAVYHRDFRMGEHNLSDLFRLAKTDAKPLLRELAGTRMVKPGNSARSSLVNALIGSQGPMFRVFSPEDVKTISRWIDWLPHAERQPEQCPAPPAPRPPNLKAVNTSTGWDGPVPADRRDAYFLLQGRALAPATRQFAIRYVKQRLAKAKLSLGRLANPLPTEWTPAGLRSWLLDMHDRHGVEFEASQSAQMPSREEVIDSTLQLAPLTLIDGSWLQGFTDSGLATTQFGLPLFETYWDELGNGEMPMNHPKIYRDVLREMGIELPPTGSREFAYDQRFRDESFERPVYWLCLGKLPRTFLPEILGMNLAMELSGVGGSYRTARIFLRHYGFSTYFVDLHNTIDNVSTGHSAWAADAIDAYMRDIAKLADPKKFATEWQRVRVGYASLAPVPLKISNIVGYRFLSWPWRRRSGGQETFHHTPIGRRPCQPMF